MPTKKKPAEEFSEDRALINTVLDILEAKRMELGMSQVAFCSKAGVSDQTWLYWMRGRKHHGGRGSNPKLSTLAKLIRAHNLQLSLMADTDVSGATMPDKIRQLAMLMRILPADKQADVLLMVEQAIQRMLAK